jgi:hypothetical protein
MSAYVIQLMTAVHCGPIFMSHQATESSLLNRDRQYGNSTQCLDTPDLRMLLTSFYKWSLDMGQRGHGRR